MKMSDYLEMSNKIKTILGIEVTPVETKEFKYKQYLSDSKDGYDYLLDCIKAKKTKTLVLAPTGAGKTYVFDTLFKDINKDVIGIRKEVESFDMTKGRKEAIRTFFMDSLKHIPVLIMLTPNRIQNEQNGVSYSMTSVIGKKNNLYVYDVEKVNTFSAVYEKITELVEFCNKNRKKKLSIKLVIDEAQLLQDAILYRNETIENIHKVEDFIMEREGSIVYLTATPEPIQNLSFDRICFFSKEGYKAPMGVINVVTNSDNKCSMDKFVLNQIATDGKKHFVRYNDKAACKNLCNNLNFDYNKNALSVNSEEKDFVERVNKYTGEKELVFSNNIFNDVANYSTLPAINKGTEATHWFSTSLFDVGTNVKGITEYPADGENECKVFHNINEEAEYLLDEYNPEATKYMRKYINGPAAPIPFPEDIIADFVVPRQNSMNTVSIIQFFNRLRYQTSEANIYLPDVENTSFYNKDGSKSYVYSYKYTDKETGEEKTVIEYMKSLEEIVSSTKKLVDKQFEIYKKSMSIIKDRAVNDADYEFQIKRELNLRNSRDGRVYFRCIRLNEELVPYVDTNILFKEAYDDYQSQFAFYHDALADKLREELNVEVVIKKEKKTALDYKNIEKEHIQNVLCAAIENTDFLSQINDNRLVTPELKILRGSDQYDKVRNLMRFGLDTKEAVEFVATTTPYKVTKKINSLTRNLAKTFTDKQKSYVVSICKDKMKISDIKNDSVRDKVYTLLNSNYSNYIKKAILFDMDVDFLFTKLIKSTSPNNLKKDIQSWIYIENNKKFIDNPELVTLPEQKIMLQMFYRFNEDGKLIQSSISNRSGNKYLEELKKFGNHDNFTLKDFFRIASDIFVLYEKEYGFVVAGLKTTI